MEHPNILAVYECGEQDGQYYVIMAYMPDGSLADLVAPAPTHRLNLPLPPATVMGFVEQVAAALQVARSIARAKARRTMSLRRPSRPR